MLCAEAFAANIANRVRCVAQIKGVQQALSVSLQSDYRVLVSSVDVHKTSASFPKLFCLKGDTV